MDRRRLLHLAAAAAFQSHALDRVRAATSAAGTRTPEEIAADEDFWSEIRSAFSIDRNIINAPAPPPDERLMAELRLRFLPEVVALSEYLDRDLVALWGYDDLG